MEKEKKKIDREYTGFKDKNGKEIFDGDILELDKDNYGTVILTNDWEIILKDPKGSFDDKYYLKNFNDEAKVIGNQYDNSDYKAEIDKVLSKETVGQKEETNYIKICNTPDVFKSIGLEDKDITIKRNKIRICNLPKEEGGHNITKEIYYKLPELFQSPAYILKSKTEAKSVVAILNEIDDEKMPILVAIKPDEKGIYEFQTIDTNLLKSIYGRDKFEKFINDNKENLLFKDDKQIAELNEKIGIMQAAKTDDLEQNKKEL